MVSNFRRLFYQFFSRSFGYHKSKDDYFEAKALLFKQLLTSDKTAVLNVNNRIKLLAEELKSQGNLVVTLGKSKGSNIQLKRQTFDSSGQEVFFKYDGILYQKD